MTGQEQASAGGNRGSETLYAQWELAIPPVCNDGNSLGMYQSILWAGCHLQELDVVLGEYVTVSEYEPRSTPIRARGTTACRLTAQASTLYLGNSSGAVNETTSHIIQFDLSSPTTALVGWATSQVGKSGLETSC